MPRKRKTGSPPRQAPPPFRELLDAIAEELRAFNEQNRPLRDLLKGDEFRHPDLAKLLGEIKRMDLDKLRQLVGAEPAKFRRLTDLLRETGSAAPPVEPKPKQRRVKIPHADEAIDQMLKEMRADPDKFQLKKERVGRVVDILKKQYRVSVAESQERTLGRWIDERIAQSGKAH